MRTAVIACFLLSNLCAAQAGLCQATSATPPQVEPSASSEPGDPSAPGTASLPPGARLHDGFYVRTTLGIGHVATSVRGGDASPSSVDVSGVALGADVMIGGSPVPGVTLGGAILTDQAPSPEVRVGDDSATLDGEMTFIVLGPFADFYPNPRGGFHLGAAAGFATATLSVADGSAAASASGIAGTAFLGYDFWTGDEWSLGAAARATAGRLSSPEDEQLRPYGFGFSLSALYH